MSLTTNDDLRLFLRRLPKAELHLHVEGTIEPSTLVELSERHDRDSADGPLDLKAAERLYRYQNFTEFMMAFKAVTSRLRTPEDYELTTYRMIQKLASQGVVHAEVYVSVGVVFFWKKMEFEPLFAGMEQGRIRGEHDFGVTLYWIFDAARQFGLEEAKRVFDKTIELLPAHPSIIGIGIGGDERVLGAEPFRDLYANARDHGLRLTAHAGETVGPEIVWATLNIGAERLGHALSAIDDPELVTVLAEQQVPLEICISSNLRTGCCPALQQHPVKRYFDAGLMVTLNSDDPAMFFSDLESEYLLAHKEFDFTPEQLREVASNSIEASFLPADRKVSLLREINSLE